MTPVSERLPEFDETLRVLIYTEGHDFGGEQFFDVKAVDLYDPSHPDEVRPEVCEYASHWMPLPYPRKETP